MLTFLQTVGLYLLTLLISFGVGWQFGTTKQQQREANKERLIVEQLLEQSTQQIISANKTSEALLIRMQSRALQDQKHTKELHDALAETADARIECRLPDNGMQHLYQAQERAAQATTGSTRTTMSNTSNTPK